MIDQAAAMAGLGQDDIKRISALIRTVARKGFRFVGEVKEGSNGSAPAAVAPVSDFAGGPMIEKRCSVVSP